MQCPVFLCRRKLSIQVSLTRQVEFLSMAFVLRLVFWLKQDRVQQLSSVLLALNLNIQTSKGIHILVKYRSYSLHFICRSEMPGDCCLCPWFSMVLVLHIVAENHFSRRRYIRQKCLPIRILSYFLMAKQVIHPIFRNLNVLYYVTLVTALFPDVRQS